MKTTLLPVLISLTLASMLPAQTCREVVRDASGWIVLTTDRQKSAGDSVQSTTRDASLAALRPAGVHRGHSPAANATAQAALQKAAQAAENATP